MPAPEDSDRILENVVESCCTSMVSLALSSSAGEFEPEPDFDAGTDVARRLGASTVNPLPLSSDEVDGSCSSSTVGIPSELVSVLRVLPNQDFCFETSNNSGAPTVEARFTPPSASASTLPTLDAGRPSSDCVLFPVTLSAVAASFCCSSNISETVRSFRLASPQIPPRCLYCFDSKNAISSMLGRTTDSLIYSNPMSKLALRSILSYISGNSQSPSTSTQWCSGSCST